MHLRPMKNKYLSMKLDNYMQVQWLHLGTKTIEKLEMILDCRVLACLLVLQHRNVDQNHSMSK